jgi:hypothetical protein
MTTPGFPEPDICGRHPDACVNYPDTDHAPDFPEGFQGAGPVFAAVPDMSDEWYRLAASGASTFTADNAGFGPDGPASAFLDRADAEAAANASGAYEGTTASHEPTAARVEAERLSDAEAWGGRGPSASYAEWLAEGQEPDPDPAIQAEIDAEEGAPEWDDAESSAYVDRVEAGLEPEA